MSVNKKTEKKNFEWHDQQEKILKKWSEMGASYRYLHDRSYAYYNKQNFRFALPVIVLSTITGTANFALKSFPEAWRETVPLVIGFLNLYPKAFSGQSSIQIIHEVQFELTTLLNLLIS